METDTIKSMRQVLNHLGFWEARRIGTTGGENCILRRKKLVGIFLSFWNEAYRL